MDLTQGRQSTFQILKVRGGLVVKCIERRADEVRAEAEEEEAERVHAESRGRQNMSPPEAKVEGLERANASLAAPVARLEGARRPPLPLLARADVPQLLGQLEGQSRQRSCRIFLRGSRTANRKRATHAQSECEWRGRAMTASGPNCTSGLPRVIGAGRAPSWQRDMPSDRRLIGTGERLRIRCSLQDSLGGSLEY